jgi:murein DD-endopeptidase MepM/ murein hydrolase activator NlpD
VVTIVGSFAQAAGTNEFKNKLDKVNKEMDATRIKLQEAKKQKTGLLDEKEKIDQEVDAAEEELKKLNELLKLNEEKIAKNELELSKNIEDVQEQSDVFMMRARAMYEDGTATYLDILLDSENYSDLLSRLDIIKEIMEYDQSILKELNQKQREILQIKEEQEAKKSLNEKLRNQVSDKKQQLESSLISKSQLIQKLTSEEKQYAETLDDLEEASREMEKEIKRLQDLSKKQYVGGQLLWPTPNYYNITSPYGNRWHPILKKYKIHTGIDTAAPMGANVVAANDGKVLMAGWNTAYGKRIIIDHGGGLSTLYAHNSTLLVSEGQQVKKGRLLRR